jgi:hypothetical protein
MRRPGDDDDRTKGFDERDHGVRPEAMGLFALAEKLDAEKAAIRAELEAEVQSAIDFAKRGELLGAAAIFHSVAERWRAHGFAGEAECWERRAADCRSAHALKKRNARKGRGAR